MIVDIVVLGESAALAWRIKKKGNESTWNQMMVWVKGKGLQAEVTRIFSRAQRFYFKDDIKRTGQWVLYLYHFARFKVMYTTGFKLNGQEELGDVV